MALIELRDVGIEFPIYGAKARSFRQALFHRRTGGTPHENVGGVVTVTALSGLTLDIEDGDRLALIGHNGSGKSTLLRVLAGVYEPTMGSLKCSGRISALFNPSLGMDPDDTAIENIFTIGLFLGMSKAEIAAKVDDIAEFTELGEFLYLPVKTYSTGMQLRLSFAVSTAIDPEILLLDEGIGMGDARFAERAHERMTSLLNRTRAIVVASHSESLVRQLCNKALLLESGRVVFLGDIEEALAIYHTANMNHNAA